MQRTVLPVFALVAFCSAVAVLLTAEQSSPAGAPVHPAATYCNPLPIPDYPIGKNVRDIVPGTPVGATDLWLQDHMEQFRELADVTVLWHEGKWYMYPSVDMAWVSSDGGISWQHHPLNIRDIGYAPTIVRHKGRFLLMASESEVYTSDSWRLAICGVKSARQISLDFCAQVLYSTSGGLRIMPPRLESGAFGRDRFVLRAWAHRQRTASGAPDHC